MKSSPTKHQWQVSPGAAKTRLDIAVAAGLPGVSRSAAQRMVRDGMVKVNGAVETRGSTVIGPGDEVSATLPGTGANPATATSGPPPRIMFEDGHLLVVDKPAGVTVHPGPGHRDGSLVDMLVVDRPEMAGVGQPDRPGVVHRLDMDTSGLLVLAKTQAAYDGLTRMLKARDVKRTYTALVAGAVEQRDGVIEAPVGRDPANRTRQAVVSTGKPARTRFKVLRQLNGAALVEVKLETGRMHQIRVHMAAVGHPVIGDPVYAGRNAGAHGLKRQFLHASGLAFTHPVTGAAIDIASSLPEDLATVLRDWDLSS